MIGFNESTCENKSSSSDHELEGRHSIDFEARRKFSNSDRRRRYRENKKVRNEQQRQDEDVHDVKARRRREQEWGEEKKQREAIIRRWVLGDQRNHHEVLQIVVDCSFALDTDEKQMRSLVKQLELCVGHTRRSKTPCLLTFAGMAGRVLETASRMSLLSNKPEDRLFRIFEGSAVAEFLSEDLVVLSPDAREPLPQIDLSKVYVIGGIVDRTVNKGMTLNMANLNQIKHCYRLPIPGKSIVLNIDTVLLALLSYQECGNWGKALTNAIPKRKGTYFADARDESLEKLQRH